MTGTAPPEGRSHTAVRTRRLPRISPVARDRFAEFVATAVSRMLTVAGVLSLIEIVTRDWLPVDYLTDALNVIGVPADRSLLDVLSDAGQFITHDCRTGFCGLCSVGVLDGEIDHRDDYLLESDKAAGKVMQVCVSRAKSALLVLDL